MKDRSTKELRYDGRAELGDTMEVMSVVWTGVAFAVLSARAYKEIRSLMPRNEFAS